MESDYRNLDSINLARAFEVLGDLGNAICWYSQAAKNEALDHRDRWLAAFRTACCQKSLANTEEALTWGQIAFELWPERVESIVLIARLLREGGEIGQARALLKTAVQQDLTEPSYHHIDEDYKLHRYAELARCEYALKNFRRAVENVNLYTHNAFRMGYDAELLRLRDDAYQKWSASRSQFLPSADAQRNRFLIIIAFRNAGEFLKNCVHSIVQQTYRSYEVIFIDDCSDNDDLAALDLSQLARYRIVRNQVRKGALANQIGVLIKHTRPSDIAVFLDGDDCFAHSEVLTHLDTLYRETHCWASYGQARFMPAGHPGFARPIMPDENTETLFTTQPMMFPIHLRTHRAGLIQCLQEEDPDLNSFKDRQGNFLMHASDIAHMRVIFSLAGLSRVAYVPEVLYEYNTGNPLSHHRQSREALSADASWIAELPPLRTVSSYLPEKSTLRTDFASVQTKVAGAAKLILISLEGADPVLIDTFTESGLLPEFRSHLPRCSRLNIPEFYANDIFWRGIYTGLDPTHYAANYRSVPAADSYFERSCFDTPALSTIDGFWNSLALNAYRVAILNPVDVSLPVLMPGLTSLSNWMIHAPMERPISNPPELLKALSSGPNYDRLLQTLDSLEVVSASKVAEIMHLITRRQTVKSRCYERLLVQGDWDFFSMGFDATHDALHKLWHFHDPTSPLYEEIQEDPIVSSYQHTSRTIDKVLANAGNSPVAVVCGLGGRSNSSLNSMLGKILWDIEALLRGAPPPQGVADRWLYQISSAPLAGAVRFNLKGREQNGQLSAEQVPALVSRMRKLFLSLKIVDSSERVVAKFIHNDVDRSGGYVNSMPDLIIKWATINPRAAITSELLGDYQFLDAQRTLLDYRSGDHNSNAAVYFNDRFQDLAQLPEELTYTELASYLEKVVVDSSN
jgi:glycosyltransferase involved in cell wall biosynthesis/predicted AlkP superfamily phosphohydrolase/phosphomutase